MYAFGSSLSAPTVSATVATVDQGQTSVSLASNITTGIAPYTYEWSVEVPEATVFSRYFLGRHPTTRLQLIRPLILELIPLRFR